MKPLVVRPKEAPKKVPGKDLPKAGKSGEGANSALEQLIHQERARILHNANEPPKDPPAP